MRQNAGSNGFETWRRLFRKFAHPDATKHVSLLTQLLDFKFNPATFEHDFKTLGRQLRSSTSDSSNNGPAPMDIGALWRKGKGKGDPLWNKSKGKGKGKGLPGKGKGMGLHWTGTFKQKQKAKQAKERTLERTKEKETAKART